MLITEVGGTVGDIESLPFLEAIRQFRKDIGRDNVLYIHVTLVPVIGVVGEPKTKPTQHWSPSCARSASSPTSSSCARSSRSSRGMREKIALFCDVEPEAVVSAVRRRRHLQGAARHARRGPRRPGRRACSGSRRGRRT